MRVLIADDDPVARRLLEGTVARIGHEVLAVSNGTDALEALLQPDGPRFAILDWMMPGMDGLAVCRAVRQRMEPYVYVILLTARDGRQDREVALEAEADDFLTKPFDLVELRARLRCGERVVRLQEELLRSQAELRHEATHDRLTGLWNRGMILDQLDRELRRASRAGTPVSVAMADLDHFKLVNDTHGHAAGDLVLKEAANRMRSVLRDYDYVGRYGGEEFLLLLPGSDLSAARQVGQRSIEALRSRPIEAGAVSLRVTLSIGVASSTTSGTEPTQLLLAADEALYRAKGAGRNCISE